jgi:hypothetical protein
MARAAAALSPTVPARVAERPGDHDRQCDADEEQRIDLERALQIGVVGPESERDRAEPRRGRLDVGLAKKERDTDAEQHHRDPDSDVVDPRQTADRTMHGPENRAGEPRRDNADPRVAGVVGRRIGDHRAQHQRAFEAEIHPAGFFSQAFAERDEHERRRQPDRFAEHGDEDRKDCLVHMRFRPLPALKIANRP